jgi:hypothetical protein
LTFEMMPSATGSAVCAASASAWKTRFFISSHRWLIQ